MGARHVAIDPERRRFPISGTQLRADLGAHWSMLTPPAKAHFARRICVLGAASTGTTTFARALARRYRTAWVPEYGRWYWEGRRYTLGAQRWDAAEFARIAAGQLRWEADLAPLANRLLILDTDALATTIWQERYTGEVTAEVAALAARSRADLTLLTAPDIPFVEDGTRAGEERVRRAMHTRFRGALRASGRPYLTVVGGHRERLRAAAERLDGLLHFAPLPDP